MKQLSYSIALAFIVSANLLAQCAPSIAKDRKITGTIRGFECGDNCYLTIIDSKKVKQVGLCEAPECQDWNGKTEMSPRYKGKRVTVTVGQGTQYDGSGDAVAEMMAFTKIRFLD